jgi:hypothetical protein
LCSENTAAYVLVKISAMKNKITFLKTSLLVLLLTFAISSCKKDNLKKELEAEYRQIAWNHLVPSVQAKVTTKVEDARIDYAVRDGQETVSVMFNTTEDLMLGPIIVYILIADKHVLGVAPRF